MFLDALDRFTATISAVQVMRALARTFPDAFAAAAMCQLSGIESPAARPGTPLWKATVEETAE